MRERPLVRATGQFDGGSFLSFVRACRTCPRNEVLQKKAIEVYLQQESEFGQRPPSRGNQHGY